MTTTDSRSRVSGIIPLNSVITAIRLLVSLGLKPEALIAGTAITPHQLGLDRSCEQVAPFADLITVFENAIALSDVPDLGLKLGEAAGIGIYGSLGLAMLCSSTDIDAVNLALKYQKLFLGTEVTISLLIENDTGLIRVNEALPSERLSRFYVEQLLAGFLRFNDTLSEQPSRIRELRLAYANPGYRHRYEAVFGCPVRFSCAHHELVFNTDILGVPLPNADPMAARALETICEDLHRRFDQPGPVTRQTRQLLHQRWGQQPGMADIARALGYDARTLRRKLRSEGSSFRDIKNRVRCALAVEFLRHSDKSVREIAALVGYEEAGTFRRAFEQWTGRQPGYYRA